MAKSQPETVIAQVFRQYHAELLAEIERAETLLTVKRIYDAGKSLEIAMAAIIDRLLPDWVGVTRGKVISSDCQAESNEIDLILYDKRYFSGLVVSEAGPDVFSYICIDTVLGVLAVKKTLTRAALKDSIHNLESVTELRRESLRDQIHFDVPLINMTYREGIELNRIFTGVVGYSNTLLFKTKNKKLTQKCEKHSMTFRLKTGSMVLRLISFLPSMVQCSFRSYTVMKVGNAPLKSTS